MTDIALYVKNQADMVSNRLSELLSQNMSTKVLDAMQYSVKNGGKRIRPILAMEFSKFLQH